MRVRFLPRGQAILVSAGTTLLAAARAAGMPLGSSCRGEGVCGWCKVQILSGAAALSPIAPTEAALLGRLEARPDERLACCAAVWGAVSLTTMYW